MKELAEWFGLEIARIVVDECLARATELNGEVPPTFLSQWNGYLGIVIPELKAKLPVQAIDGRCLKCGYRLPLQRRIICSLAYIILFSVGVSFAPSSLAQSGGQATLILKVTGLRSEKGQVKIAVFNSSEKWLGEQPIYSLTINVDSQTVTWRINDVPYGDYGVAVFHDENSNGKIDKNLLGIPQSHTDFQIM